MANQINLFFIPVILVLLVSINQCSSIVVYLKENSTNSDCSNTTSDNPCNNLSDALIHTVTYATLTIYSGNYTLSSNYTFTGVSDISIIAAGDASVVIACNGTEKDTGIAFISAKYITIYGITFVGCGMEQKSTTQNFTVQDLENKLFLVNVVSTLYFESCETISLSSVLITESRGMAVQMYSTNGTVEISNSNFTNNRGCYQSSSSNDSDHCNNVTYPGILWGGGVYIEFPFCVPGDNSCSQQNISSVDFHSVSNSNYSIIDCVFDGNIAHDPMEQRLVMAYDSYHKATGRGGGVSIFFKGAASNNVITIERCHFNNNTAIYGGGAYVEMQDSANGNTVTVTNSNFTNNTAVSEGGGMYVSYSFLSKEITGSKQQVEAGNITLQHLQLTNNIVQNGKGGAISYTTTKQPNSEDESSNKFSIYDCNFTSNTGFIGAAAKISVYAIEDNGYYLHPVTMSNILIHDNTNNTIRYNNGIKPLGSGALYVSNVPIHLNGSLKFTSNNNTALAAYHSKMVLQENSRLVFTENSGYNGGALSLQSSSVLILNKNVSMRFTSNTALNKGGAIFASYDDPSTSIETQGCFIQYCHVATRPEDWNVTVEFVENQAGNESNSIYASSLLPCVLGRPFGVLKDLETLLKDAFCWNGKWTYNGTSESCNKHIQTDISQFKKEFSPLEVVPGKVTQMGVTALDEQGDEIQFSITVHAYSLDQDVRVDSDYAYISNDQIKLKNFNISKQNTTVWIQLDTVGQQQKKQMIVEVLLKNCSPGYHLDTEQGVCVCSGTFGSVLKCNESTMTASLLSGYWIGHISCSDEIIVTHCRQSCDYRNATDGYYELGNDFDSVNTCRENSRGQICSLCRDDYKPSIDVDSFECVKCNSSSDIGKGVFMFVLFDVVFPITFIVAIGIADVRLTSGLLHGPIFFAQMITSIVSLDADDVIQYKDLGHGAGNFSDVFEKFYTSAYDIFNLEFLMFMQKWCLGFNHSWQVVALQFITGFVPMIMVIMFWVFYRCYDRPSRSNTESKMKLFIRKYAKGLPNLFATCILLSYTKVAVTLCFLLAPISLVNANGKYGNYSHSVLYDDGSVCYPDNRLLFSLVVAVVFLIPVPILLIFFRYRKNSESFFGRVLYQFQSEFRKGRNEFEAIHGNGNYSCTGKRSIPGAAFCDPCHMCCGIEIDSRTEYEYECCTSSYVCRYYQKRSRCCPCAIHTSFDFLDFRWLSGFMFILRIIMIIPFVWAYTTVIRYTLQLAICMFTGILILVIKPYKRNLYKYVDCNRVEAFFFFNLAFILVLCIYQYYFTTTEGLTLSLWGYILQVLLVMVPLLWIVVVYCILVRKRWSHVSCTCRCFRYCCSKPDQVDEWEHLWDPADQVVQSESYQLRDRSGEESDNGVAPTVRLQPAIAETFDNL